MKLSKADCARLQICLIVESSCVIETQCALDKKLHVLFSCVISNFLLWVILHMEINNTLC